MVYNQNNNLIATYCGDFFIISLKKHNMDKQKMLV